MEYLVIAAFLVLFVVLVLGIIPSSIRLLHASYQVNRDHHILRYYTMRSKSKKTLFPCLIAFLLIVLFVVVPYYQPLHFSSVINNTTPIKSAYVIECSKESSTTQSININSPEEISALVSVFERYQFQRRIFNMHDSKSSNEVDEYVNLLLTTGDHVDVLILDKKGFLSCNGQDMVIMGANDCYPRIITLISLCGQKAERKAVPNLRNREPATEQQTSSLRFPD